MKQLDTDFGAVTLPDTGLDPETEQELAEVELGVLTATPSLSDLIREGASKVGHAVGSWFEGEKSACALGTALIAARNRGLV